ncbi:MAG: transglycosylase SLT domain-containing protein [Prevotella sp.]|nr:transglycosylase SLT domain-containing protein [Prevotella sp.]
MMRTLKLFFVAAALFCATSNVIAEDFESNSNVTGTEVTGIDWTPVINAIIQVESGGNPNARNGQYAGVLQIAPVMVAQCNQILKKENSSKRYTLNDRFNVAKSKEMFILVQKHYNKSNSIERAIRMWQGGPGYSIKGTQRYYNKVMSIMRGMK